MPLYPPSTGAGTHVGRTTVRRTTGNLSPGASAGAFSAVSSTLDVAIAAAAGDLVMFGISLRAESGPQTYLDVATMVSGAPLNWIGSTGAAGDLGVAAWLIETSTPLGRGGSVPYIVVAGDIVAGVVTFRLFYRTGSAVTPVFDATAPLPLSVFAQNLGQ